MKQVIQSFRTGLTEVIDTPAPAPLAGHVVIRTHASLVSAGTERMLVEFGRASLLEKARQQPDRVGEVISKIRADGLVATISAVTAKLDQPIPLGYCNVGTVIEVGEGVSEFAVGDRVASNGAHAEVVRVPTRLCARVPQTVDDQSAVFTVIGSIALQGVRLLGPQIGETIVVTGLGLVGLMAVQILRANGCRVVGIDLQDGRLELAAKFGASVLNSSRQDVVASVSALTSGRGADGVLVAVSTTSSQPISDAAKMSRQRGRIVLVGVAGLELARAEFYAKELTFQVSCSYGPGRYDPSYEFDGHDYPVGFVRWTEQRNFDAILGLLAEGSLRAAALITHRVPIEAAASAYDALVDDQQALGIVLTYPARETDPVAARTILARSAVSYATARPAFSMIGAGNHAVRTLLPAFRKAGVRFRTIATNGSVLGAHAGRKFGFEQVSTDIPGLLGDVEACAVVIATRHDSHADLVCQALSAGKHVFVEKPLALSSSQLSRIRDHVRSAPPDRVVTVGFNRRFAPLAQEMRKAINAVPAPRTFIYTVNAGQLPATHWSKSEDAGGGRVLGEACHFIDLLRFLSGSPIARVRAQTVGSRSSGGLAESANIDLLFVNGDAGTIHYLADGNRAFPKERIEVFAAGSILRLLNFRRLEVFGWPGATQRRSVVQNKGQAELVASFVAAVEGKGPWPIPIDEIFEVAEATLECAAATGLKSAAE